jgi:prophage tail gpP-like protein
MKSKPSKYRNRKVIVDGKVYASGKEYLRFKELELLERAGKIQNLKRQVDYLLIPAQFGMVVDPETGLRKRKCLERACSYIADFTYTENGQLVVEDTKGFRTADYKIKRKLMLQNFGIAIRET